MTAVIGEFSFDRMERAVNKVQERLLRTADALEAAGVPYAVVGGNAVAVWVARVDEAAVRNTRDVDILLCRSDMDRARTAMEAAGFTYRHAGNVDMFLDGPDAKARDAVHVVFAGEKVRPDELASNPAVEESEFLGRFRVINLDALVRIKLTAFRIKDQTHLLDLIELDLIDETWIARFPSELGARLRSLIDSDQGRPIV